MITIPCLTAGTEITMNNNFDEMPQIYQNVFLTIIFVHRNFCLCCTSQQLSSRPRLARTLPRSGPGRTAVYSWGWPGRRRRRGAGGGRPGSGPWRGPAEGEAATLRRAPRAEETGPAALAPPQKQAEQHRRLSTREYHIVILLLYLYIVIYLFCIIVLYCYTYYYIIYILLFIIIISL